MISVDYLPNGWQSAVNQLMSQGYSKSEAKKRLRVTKAALIKSMATIKSEGE